MHKLFVYGTLMFPEIFKRVTSSKPSYVPAVLKGYHRFNIKTPDGGKLPYPAIYPAKDGIVHGLVTEVSEADLTNIDEYEADEYERVMCTVMTDRGECEAFVYVWNSDPAYLSGTWEPGK